MDCNRRELLQLGSLGFFGLTLPGWMHARRPTAKARSCIVVWLNGGPSHLDTFDLKPNAPGEVRGEFKPARTPVDGLRISEHLPRIARIADRLSVIRTLTSVEGNHDRASHHYMTGYHPSPALTYPSVGAVVNKRFGPAKDVPLYISVPVPPQYAGAGYLGAAHGPFSVDRRLANGEAPVEANRMKRRVKMLKSLDALGDSIEENEAVKARDSFYEQAYRLMASSEAKQAFELEREPAKVQNRYGRFRIGRGCLMARRLVEAGARFVTVNDNGWDTHQNNFTRLKEGFPGKLPGLDQAYAALIEDLDARGLLDETLVILMGEFGRTPRINASAGRDHWPRANSVVLAGAGIRKGVVHGKTDAFGELPAEDPVEPEDLLATVYHLIGVDPTREFKGPGDQPVRILPKGRIVKSVLA